MPRALSFEELRHRVAKAVRPEFRPFVREMNREQLMDLLEETDKPKDDSAEQGE